MLVINVLIIIIVNSMTPIKCDNRLNKLIIGLIVLLCNKDILNVISRIEMYNGYIINNNMHLIINLSLIVVLYISISLINYNPKLYIIIIISNLGSILLVNSNHIIILILSLEIQSFSLYLLVYLSDIVLIGLKYILLGSLSSGMILIGISLIYNNLGVIDFQSLLELNNNRNNIGLIIILIGCIFKLAIVPFHIWAPEIYGKISTKLIIYVSLIPKLSVIVFVSKIIIISNNNIFIILSILSIIIGSLGGLIENNFNRLITYSSISHIGYILICSIISLDNLIIYLIQYVLTSLSIFYLFHSISSKNNFNNFNNLTLNIYQILSISILLLSLAGIPPLLGFFVKLQLINNIIYSEYYILIFIMILTSVISGFYYLRFIYKCFSLDYKIEDLNVSIFIISLIIILLFSWLDYNILEQVFKILIEKI